MTHPSRLASHHDYRIVMPGSGQVETTQVRVKRTDIAVDGQNGPISDASISALSLNLHRRQFRRFSRIGPSVQSTRLRRAKSSSRPAAVVTLSAGLIIWAASLRARVR